MRERLEKAEAELVTNKRWRWNKQTFFLRKRICNALRFGREISMGIRLHYAVDADNTTKNSEQVKQKKCCYGDSNPSRGRERPA